jgi:hypothetical protein
MPRVAGMAILRHMMDAGEQLCRLEQMQGRTVRCPEEKCALWEPGGAVLDGRCVLHGIDFAHEPGLANWLLEFRDGLARGAEE